VALGQVFSENFGFPANLHSICFSTIIFTITRGWHNMPGVAAVPLASKTKDKKIKDSLRGDASKLCLVRISARTKIIL
jgi:hypothetical protein